MNAKEAAQALFEAVRHKSQPQAVEIAQRFIAHLQKTGRLSLLPRVVREFERKTRTGGIVPTLVLASEGEGSRLKEDIVNSLSTLSAHHAPVTTIDPSLVSGFILSHQGKRIDASGKRSLIELYRHLTT